MLPPIRKEAAIVLNSRLNCTTDEPNKVGTISFMILRTPACAAPHLGRGNKPNRANEGNWKTSCKMPAANTPQAKALIDPPISGTSPTVFHDGDMSYIVSTVRSQVDCQAEAGQDKPLDPSGAEYKCYSWTSEVQVVDTSNGGAKLRGKIALPHMGANYNYSWGWGWGWKH